jgi:hypothetical protein
MTDLDRTFQAAIAAAAARAVPPSLADLAYRGRARRVRRVAAVAIASVAVLASAAIAVPKLTGGARGLAPAGGGDLKPYSEFVRDPLARQRYERCALALADPRAGRTLDDVTDGQLADCVRRAGYAAPPEPESPPVVCPASGQPLAAGTADGYSWQYTIGASTGGGTCTWVRVDGVVRRGGTSTSSTPGEYSAGVLLDVDSDWVLLTFAAPGKIVRADVTVDGERHSAQAVAVRPGGVRYYAVAVRAPDHQVDVHRVEYDAAGKAVNRPDDLHLDV